MGSENLGYCHCGSVSLELLEIDMEFANIPEPIMAITYGGRNQGKSWLQELIRIHGPEAVEEALMMAATVQGTPIEIMDVANVFLEECGEITPEIYDEIRKLTPIQGHDLSRLEPYSEMVYLPEAGSHGKAWQNQYEQKFGNRKGKKP